MISDTTIPTDAIKIRGLKEVRGLQISAIVVLTLIGLIFATVRSDPTFADSILISLISLLFVCLLSLPVKWLIHAFAMGRTENLYNEALCITLGFILVAATAAAVVHLLRQTFGLSMTRGDLVPILMTVALLSSIFTVGWRSARAASRVNREASAAQPPGPRLSLVGLALIVLVLAAGTEFYVYTFLIGGFAA